MVQFTFCFTLKFEGSVLQLDQLPSFKASAHAHETIEWQKKQVIVNNKAAASG